MTGRPRPTVRLRSAHAVMVGAATASLAAAAHVLAGGEAPGLLGLAVLSAVAAVVAATALPTRPSAGRVVAVVVATQAALHVLLALEAVASAPAGGVTMMSGMDHGAAASATASHAAAGSWSQLVEHLVMGLTGRSGALMTAAHVAAAVLLGLWLAAADRVATTLGSLSRVPVLARVLRLVAVQVRVAAAVRSLWSLVVAVLRRCTDLVLVRPSSVVLEQVTRRGPPTLLAWSTAV